MVVFTVGESCGNSDNNKSESELKINRDAKL